MKILSEITFRYLFKAFCMVCLLSMVVYWIYKFVVEDRDIGTVDYLSFNEDSNVKHPVASLCFVDPIVDRKVAEHHPNLDTKNYTEYLKGNDFEEGFAKIDYSNITMAMNDYFSYSSVFLRNKTTLETSKNRRIFAQS